MTDLTLYHCAVSERTSWLVLRLRTSDGLTAYGECSDGGPLADVVAALDEWTPFLQAEDVVGDFARDRDAHRVRDLSSEVGSLRGHFTAVRQRAGARSDFLHTTVWGGIEQALCDLAARAAGVPLWRWLGGTRPEPIPLYANINRAPGGREPRDVAATAGQAVAAGFGGVKLAPFDTPGDRPLPDLGLSRVRAVRQALGPDPGLMVDCHERVVLDELLPVLDDLLALRLDWLEDAVGIEHVDELRRLRRYTGEVRLAGGEFATDRGQVEAVADLLDVVMPDVKHAGGVHAALALAHAAIEVGASVSLHNPSGPIATAFGAHVAAVVPGVLEYAFGEVPWRGDVLTNGEPVRHGHYIVPDGPGIGLDLDTTHSSVTPVWSVSLQESG
ncbi:enolase C-terminal domain-like protein [Embleya scabrispora]|uniref:enolase C-terminal domain-like protein n=1 Tax=Embleya scabrispora TaxID=159449 RepID=UPI001374C9C2|nr:enolase C-terminal domain-like protein [Embleya scabrispora]